MAQFQLKIAGHTGRITSLFDSTRDYCKDYLTEDTAGFSYTVTREDLAFEQEFLRREAEEEGFKPRTFPAPFLERAAIQRAFGEYLLDKNVLLLHGSLVAAYGEGYFFAAKSGTGKSTHVRYWLELLGENACVINDDKPFFTVGQDGITAHGAPWSGKHGLHQNTSVPLKSICLLERGQKNVLSCAKAEDLLPILLSQGGYPLAEDRYSHYRALTEELLKKVSLWQLHCTKDISAAALAFSVMGGK